ncbi:hypothetical protein VP01_6513g2 [Puccinia sorghi]|uniref:Uncharacterized protein n=1 Tax=Puccinia sorghi TaxID=27349 RepID=A0A0L6UFK8_9BASI|nr:hypothetical protein VP01_6513g2 [Puccinia sorghi]
MFNGVNRNETMSDAEDEDINSNCDELPNLLPSGSTSNKQIPFPARKEARGWKKPTKGFYMQLVITKRQAEMTKARAMATKAQVSYMREFREMGLDFNEIKKLVDEEFPPIQNHMAESNSEDSETNDDSS